ncbi:2861_t:CDS:2 [Diversispora eburnea]|uniref:2861_t:CDS:1 n=1 Tax=Diversispora eburnea TaxID=1213867 RepID=A0A9N9GHP4_9GLOM|nr:2861_t:CDS:2 [Diversispora eburnea]
MPDHRDDDPRFIDYQLTQKLLKNYYISLPIIASFLRDCHFQAYSSRSIGGKNTVDESGENGSGDDVRDDSDNVGGSNIGGNNSFGSDGGGVEDLNRLNREI